MANVNFLPIDLKKGKEANKTNKGQQEEGAEINWSKLEKERKVELAKTSAKTGGLFSFWKKFLAGNRTEPETREKIIEAIRREKEARNKNMANQMTANKRSAPAFTLAEESPIEEKKPATKGKDIAPNKVGLGFSRPLDEEKGWKSPKAIGSNLIKEEIINFVDWPRNLELLAVFLLFVIFVLGTAFMTVKYYQTKHMKEVEALKVEINKQRSEISGLRKETEKVDIFKKKISAASQLLQNHIYWTEFFKFLEANTIKTVFFKDFSGNTGGKYTLSAMGSRFNDIAVQVKGLRTNEKVIKAESYGGTSDKNKVNFNLKLEIDPSVFLK